MILTPTVLQAAYAYLNETAPFGGWNLPDAEDVVFEVLGGGDVHGKVHPDYGAPGRFLLGISAQHHSHTDSLMVTMSHEMVHMHLRQMKYRGWKAHGKVFKALAQEVSTIHGYDPGQF